MSAEQVEVVCRNAISCDRVWQFPVGRYHLPDKLVLLQTGVDLHTVDVVRPDRTTVNAAALSITEFMQKDNVIELKIVLVSRVPCLPSRLARTSPGRSFGNNHRNHRREFTNFSREWAMDAPTVPGVR